MIKFIHKRPFVIAGPCSAESRSQLLDTAAAVAATGRADMFRAGLWKPRTLPDSFEGVGEEGIAWLAEAGRKYSLPVCTEAACARHAELILEGGIDDLWIGARTTVSPFGVQEIADALKGSNAKVLIKNPMVASVELWEGALERIERSVGVDNIALVHRGFAQAEHSDLRNEPLWHLVIEMRRRHPEIPMLCDPSHICGSRSHLAEISQQAADLSLDGLMIECHISPSEALSDASQQLLPQELDALLGEIVWRTASTDNASFATALSLLRQEIDSIDGRVFDLLKERMDVAERIGELKRTEGVTALQGSRWNQMLDRIPAVAARTGLGEQTVRAVMEAVHMESIGRQENILNRKKC